jgi:mono/diheme cytochrome c family protein/plastocyanin
MKAARILIIGVLTAGLLLAAGAYAFVGRNGLAANRQPWRVEKAVAQQLVRLSIPAAERRARNPLSGDEAWREGRDHFDEHCAVCHGGDGRGHSPLGASMYPPVPDLAAADVQRFSDGALFAIIRNGVSWTGMPAFASTHDDREIWNLVAFVRKLPALTAGDLTRQENRGDDDAHRARTDPDRPHNGVTTIAIDGTAFTPGEVTISAGQAIAWVNKDPFPHNVVSREAGMHSGDLQPDQSWRFRPAMRGTIRYVCTLHPTMSGVIHVK